MIDSNPTAPSDRPKVLVILAHPDPEQSVVNQLMIQHITDLEHVTVHDIYAAYPEFFIDVKHEQGLLLTHDVIVFQHPLFMYSCPALLKEWIDRVLVKGFAFGKGRALEGKLWRSVITAGGQARAFSQFGYNKYPLEQILQPFELTASLCRMQWVEPMVLYWARGVTQHEQYQHAEQYRQWLSDLRGVNHGTD
ncbi:MULTISPECIES: glutathione-regulated potassium-efflux system ancillary protein KefG [unclassified Vibrio]|uniref:Glutathione-regulated potassium-efflux system ancillary protein KefG n=1 Tax=Vibrio sp. HB236076 TaxID=3232307 RepID=A0AB39HG04_9VIBR|nr:glutathione-regulated potassium-efflux system ancillary protein KefG [Vibrio sp. HB161653]MDP5255327.1 glutathione-regulated potassium-efflux system ancillary protein KefG [Vibrio sp. HB161653]